MTACNCCKHTSHDGIEKCCKCGLVVAVHDDTVSDVLSVLPRIDGPYFFCAKNKEVRHWDLCRPGWPGSGNKGCPGTHHTLIVGPKVEP